MTRIEIRKTDGDKGPKVEIRIRPSRGGIAMLLVNGAVLCGMLIWLASISSVVWVLMIIVLASLFGSLGWSALPPNRATVEDAYISLQRQLLGIKSLKRLRLSGISNLRYRPRPWYGDRGVSRPSVMFSASEELGLDQGLGMGLNEEEAQEIIRCIEEYRTEVGAATQSIDGAGMPN